MRVSQTGNNPVQSTQAGEAKAAKHAHKAGAAQHTKKAEGASAEAGVAATDGANAAISGKAREFAKAQEVASNAPDVREERVAELKRRIAEGKYHVDADAIADRMVDEHLKSHLG